MNRMQLLSLLLVAFVLGLAPTFGAQEDQRTGESARLAVFDAAWKSVADHHYDVKMKGLDWDAIKKQFRTEAQRAKNDEELRAVIRAMLGKIGESHFTLVPAETAKDIKPEESPRQGGDLGMETRLVENRLAVTSVDASGPAAKKGIRPGWVITHVAGQPVKIAAPTNEAKPLPSERVLRWIAASRRLNVAPGQSVVLKMLNDQDQSVAVTIKAQEEQGSVMQLGFLPPMIAHLEQRQIKTPLNAPVGLIKFNLWTVSILPEFDQAMTKLRDSQGIVIDLRGNFGGLGGLVMGIGGHFTSKPEPLGILRFREGELTFATNPRESTDDGKPVKPYSGPLAVLIDEASASTSEFFAGGMQTLKRARIFGQTSAGMALASQFDKLPNGDLLQYAMADFTMPNGKRVEGIGIKPDEEILVNRKGLLAGEDVVLAAALKWIDTQVKK